MIPRNIFAYTSPGLAPDFLSINERDGQVVLDARGDGHTIAVAIPRKVLAEMARALVCEVIPADILAPDNPASNYDWPPRVSAFGRSDGERREGSTGQLFEVKNGQWVRV